MRTGVPQGQRGRAGRDEASLRSDVQGWVRDLGLRIWGSKVLGFRAWGLRDPGCRAQDQGIQDLGFAV